MQLSKLSFRSRSPQSICKTTAGFSPMSMLSVCADGGITHSGGQQHSLTRQPKFHKIVLFYSSDREKKILVHHCPLPFFSPTSEHFLFLGAAHRFSEPAVRLPQLPSAWQGLGISTPEQNAHLGFLFIKKQGPKYCVSTFPWLCTLFITLPLEQSDCLN